MCPRFDLLAIGAPVSLLRDLRRVRAGTLRAHRAGSRDAVPFPCVPHRAPSFIAPLVRSGPSCRTSARSKCRIRQSVLAYSRAAPP